jgi:hypothetical protein
MTNQPTKNRAAVSLGRMGGAVGIGPSKARTREQAQYAANVRWEKYRSRKQVENDRMILEIPK